MAPSWARLRSSGTPNPTASNASPTNNRNNTTQSSNKPLPRVPVPPPPLPPSQSNAFDPPPTLHHATAPQSSPRRPSTAGAPKHIHGRSVSGPLPRIFGRRKSARDLRAFNDVDVPLDDDLVPVLDDSVAWNAPRPEPARVVSGNKGKKGGDNTESKVQRRCMCCDSRVMVPRELDKFRCLECLTINDLQPVAEQKAAKEKAMASGKRAETFPGGLPPNVRMVPLSVERTRAIINRCLVTYLEARCRRQEEPPAVSTEPAETCDGDAGPSKGVPTHALPIRPRDPEVEGKQLLDAPMSSSPPDTPGSDEAPLAHTATIRDYTDIDQFAFMRMDTPPPGPPPPANGAGPSSTIPRKPAPSRPNRKPPPPPVNVTNRTPSQRLTPNGNSTAKGQPSPRMQMSPRMTPAELEQRKRYERAKSIFRPLEDYMVTTFGDFQCLNTSFSTVPRPVPQGRTRSESNIVTPPPEPMDVEEAHGPTSFEGFSEFDAKTLLLGELGENSSWWTGKLDRLRNDRSVRRKKVGEGSRRAVTSKSPNIDWSELHTWYDVVHTAGQGWRSLEARFSGADHNATAAQLDSMAAEIEEDLEEAREHASRALLKITETILKRPTQPLTEPEHLRWLIIILTNPNLYPSHNRQARPSSGVQLGPLRARSDRQSGMAPASPKQASPRKSMEHEGGQQHAGILKRAFGLLAHSPDTCHRYVIGWFSRFDEEQFVPLVDLVASFVTNRVARRSGRPRSKSAIADSGLIPDLSGSAASTSLQLHTAMGLGGSVKKRVNEQDGETDWANDWQIKAAAKVMSLLFAANNIWQGKRRNAESRAPRMDSAVVFNGATHLSSPAARARRSGQLLHTSTFYNTLLDYHDLIADFRVWEGKRDKFAFCQYPLFLSMGAKIKILEYDAKRQMEIKAREAYFDSVIRQRALDGYFHLRVRRDCMVDDSLRQISEAVGAGQEELKKGLRVHFTGEEGVDAGGPRKEWFLMLVREIFDPEHGMFVYDDESHTCYFNPNGFETSDQYYLVGALLGLAIYNSTILDVAFPPFAFRKLLAAAPSGTSLSNISSLTGSKGQMTYTIADLAEFRPSLATGLQKLLDFDGDVETTYCWDFVATVERYGTITNVPLISNGEGTPVTNANRHEFVDAYIRYLLDTSVARQFEPFKRGFFTVCAGNALSLFRAEEIELLVRGSDEALDVDSLKAVAVYENWRHFQPPHSMLPRPAETVPVLQWFWEIFAEAQPDRQRNLLTFITGSDRIPAVGATSLVLRIVAGGDGWGGGGKDERERFPVARTCFNMLVLWRYDYREALEERLWRAVEESEGFGLK